MTLQAAQNWYMEETVATATPARLLCLLYDRLARDVFLDRLGTEAAILPRLVPLGDIDEDEIAFAEAATAELAEAALAIPKAIDSLERRLLLAELILKWANSPDVRGAEGDRHDDRDAELSLTRYRRARRSRLKMRAPSSGARKGFTT